MVALPLDRRIQFTVEEYLALDANAENRHEYYGGEIISKSGEQRNHVVITGNVGAQLRNQLDQRPNYDILMSLMLVRVSETIYFYPDVVVACDGQYSKTLDDSLLNPTLIVEVTSPATALYDRTTKLEAYKRMPSVQEVLIVDQHRVHVDQYARAETAWTVREYAELTDTMTLDSIGCTLSVGDVYAKVTFTD